ncbi:MAG: hypothetical protein ACTSQY_10595 [Candidatus Odinarchaeia archaeon]
MNRVYILGAGATAHAGAPLGNNILKKYIEIKLQQLERDKKMFSKQGATSTTAQILGNFSNLHNILMIQPNCKFTHITPLRELLEENLPNIEDVFTLYDMALQKDEPFLFEADIDQNIIRKDILDLLTRTIVLSTVGALNKNFTTQPYQKFVDHLTKDDVIISYNYDTLLDNAILHKFGELNYGFDILTEENIIEPLSEEEKTKYFQSFADKEGISVEEFKAKYCHPKEKSELKFGENAPLLIKPHGSLNWLYCPKCYRYYCLRRKELINKEAFLHFFPNECMDRCGGNLQQFIVPLTHHKTFHNPILNYLWMRVTQELSMADIVYFIGYSIPDADYTSKYYFIKGLTRPNRKSCAELTLIAPNAVESGLSNKYKRIFGDVTEIFDDHVFEDVEIELCDDEIIKTPQIKEMRYKYGQEKFIVIEKKFEEWVNEIK